MIVAISMSNISKLRPQTSSVFVIIEEGWRDFQWCSLCLSLLGFLSAPWSFWRSFFDSSSDYGWPWGSLCLRPRSRRAILAYSPCQFHRAEPRHSVLAFSHIRGDILLFFWKHWRLLVRNVTSWLFFACLIDFQQRPNSPVLPWSLQEWVVKRQGDGIPAAIDRS